MANNIGTNFQCKALNTLVAPYARLLFQEPRGWSGQRLRAFVKDFVFMISASHGGTSFSMFIFLCCCIRQKSEYESVQLCLQLFRLVFRARRLFSGQRADSCPFSSRLAASSLPSTETQRYRLHRAHRPTYPCSERPCSFSSSSCDCSHPGKNIKIRRRKKKQINRRSWESVTTASLYIYVHVVSVINKAYNDPRNVPLLIAGINHN